jgi:hypothetical protein
VHSGGLAGGLPANFFLPPPSFDSRLLDYFKDLFSQQGEFKNTIKNFLGKSMSKTFGRKTKKLRKKLFSFHLFPWRFCAFLNKGSSKTPQKTFWGKSMSKAFGRKS